MTEANDSTPAQPLLGPLHDRHLESKAKMADFSGWSMPLQYPDGGVIAEHTAVRETVGLFDVSHLGKALVKGPGAAEFVNSVLTNDLTRIEPGKAQYTMCCDDATGGVVDDLIAYLRSDDEVLLVPNAANTAEVVRRMQAVAPAGIDITNMHTDYAVFAVQGPRSQDVIDALGLPSGSGYMSFVDAEFKGAPMTVCRTGYTGEKGFELVPRWEDATMVWDALLEQVVACGGRAAGLGARDTLRTEMGYALHGHELSMDITPVQAGTGWAVGWQKPAFWGRDVLRAEKEAGPKRRSRGLLALGRGIPRADQVVKNEAGEQVGVITSGTHSPTRKEGIALALLDTSIGFDDEVIVDVRGRDLRCKVMRPPFVETSTS